MPPFVPISANSDILVVTFLLVLAAIMISNNRNEEKFVRNFAVSNKGGKVLKRQIFIVLQDEYYAVLKRFVFLLTFCTWRRHSNILQCLEVFLCFQVVWPMEYVFLYCSSKRF